jgi:hypothetical protein
MNNDRILTKKFNTKPDGIRRVGRPKLRWEDGVGQDMRILEVKNWKKAALLRRPRSTKGCRANDDDDDDDILHSSNIVTVNLWERIRRSERVVLKETEQR